MCNLTFGSLFSGIGGLDLGLERAGWTCLWQIEKDSYRRAVLANHWPEITQYEDVTKLDFSNLERPALLAGGFPCQPVSTAGKMLAELDDRWLWPHFARAIRTLRPAFVLVENVPGLLVRGMANVLGDLAGLGYDAEWQMLPAAFVGAPHLRQRIFLVAYPGQWRRQVPHHLTEGEEIVFSRRLIDSICPLVRGKEHWSFEPDLVRVVHGLSTRLDKRAPVTSKRITALGDAVVPQLAELIGQLIKNAL